MPLTYDKIITTTLSANTSDVTLSSIPATYTDLILIINGSFTSSENSFGMRFNGDTTAAYSSTALYTDGTTTTSLRFSNTSRMYVGRASSTSSTTNSTSIIHIQNYSSTAINKSIICRCGSPTISMEQVAMWRSTSAVSSITIAHFDFIGTPQISAGTTFTLYGILKG